MFKIMKLTARGNRLHTKTMFQSYEQARKHAVRSIRLMRAKRLGRRLASDGVQGYPSIRGSGLKILKVA